MKMTPELVEQLKNEYLYTGISVRALSIKYGIPKTNIQKASQKGCWKMLRETMTAEQQDDTPAPVPPAISEMLKTAEERLGRCTELLNDKVYQLLELDEPLAPRDLKAISGALLDLKLLYNIKTPEERREQEARIRQLEKAVEEKQQGNSTITVFFGNEDEVTADA